MDRESLPIKVRDFDFEVRFGKNILEDQRIGIAIGYNRANIAGDAERVQDRLIDWNVTVISTGEGAVDIE